MLVERNSLVATFPAMGRCSRPQGAIPGSNTELGIPISKPWGEMRSYDFIVGRPRRFVAVQVKSTIAELGTGYVCTVRGGHKPYPPGSFDFLAA
jgi:hypothetical protein